MGQDVNGCGGAVVFRDSQTPPEESVGCLPQHPIGTNFKRPMLCLLEQSLNRILLKKSLLRSCYPFVYLKVS
jgi:hypothetical protein